MADEWDDAKLLGGPATTRPFDEQFLLAIIDAYLEIDPSSARWSKERERRLADAMKALFGSSGRSGPKSIDDRAALMWMAEEHHNDLVTIGQQKLRDRISANEAPDSPPPRSGLRKPRSNRQLAEAASKKIHGSSDEATIDRLRKAFGKRKEALLDMVRYHDQVVESLEHQKMRRLKNELAEFGIKMKTD